MAQRAEAPTAYEIQADTVTDTVTTLVWQRAVPFQSYTWSEAKAYCSTLLLDGRDDWRLPTAIEYLGIVDTSRKDPAVNPAAFLNTPSVVFWTISNYAKDPTKAWGVDFGGGQLSPYVRTNAGRVRCVRAPQAPQPSSHYAIGPDVVVDNWTGLTWQRQVPSGNYNYAQASTYCSSLQLMGSGWRVPSMKELLTLVDRRVIGVYQSTAMIDADAFPGTPAGAFKTSTAWAASPSIDAWEVEFLNGRTGYGDFANSWPLRCVR